MLTLVGRTLIIAAFYAGSGYIGLWTGWQRDLWPTLWFPSAVSLTAVVFWGPSAALGVGLGALVMRILTHASMPFILTVVVANMLEAFVGGWILGRRFDLKGRRLTTREIPKLVLTLALITNVSAVVGVGSQMLVGIRGTTGFVRDWWSLLRRWSRLRMGRCGTTAPT